MGLLPPYAYKRLRLRGAELKQVVGYAARRFLAVRRAVLRTVLRTLRAVLRPALRAVDFWAVARRAGAFLTFRFTTLLAIGILSFCLFSISLRSPNRSEQKNDAQVRRFC
jgi:hypothetical protein